MVDKKFSISSFLLLFSDRVRTFIKFGITGASGLIIDFSLTWLFKDELQLNKFLANAIGFSAAITSNYIINRYWTFKDHKSKAATQFTAFVMVSLIGLLLNSLVIFLLNNIMNINFYISKAAAVLIVFFWNFSLNYFFVFKASREGKI